MSWIGIEWRIVGGILFSAAILLLSMLILYSGPKGFHTQKQTTSDGTGTRATHSAAVCVERRKAFLTNKTWEELLCRGKAHFQAPFTGQLRCLGDLGVSWLEPLGQANCHEEVFMIRSCIAHVAVLNNDSNG